MGRAYDKIAKYDESEKAYKAAMQLKPDDDQALKGLHQLYEVQTSAKVSEYIQVSLQIAMQYQSA